MAYKFQLGTAKLSGSIEQSDGTGDLRATTVDSLNASNGGIAAAGAISGATTIAASGLASLDGGINVDDNFTVSAAGAVVAAGVNAGGAITGATSIDGSGDLTMGTITMSGFTVDADGDTVAKTVAVPDDGTIGNASRADMLTLAAAAVTVKNDADFNVAKAGGLQLAGAAVTSTAAELNLLDAITRGSIIVGNSSGASALLAKGTAGQFVISDGDDIIYRSMSADATLAANGALTIADNAVSLAKMAGIARGSLIVGDASGDPSALAKGTAGQFTVSDGDDLVYRSLSGDATLAANGALTLAAAQTNVQSITNAALILSGNAGNKLDLSNAAAAKFVIGGADKMLVNATGVTIDGNLSVLGTTTTINSTVINISKSFTFEGDLAGDNKKTILDSGLPIANTDIKLPTLGAGTYHLPVLADAPTAASALVTAAEFALLDGATAAQSVTIVDADRIILNDDGTMKQVAMSDVKTYAEEAANALTVAIVADGAGLVADKVQYVADRDGGGQSVALTLPASAAGLIGKSIYLKAGNLENGAVVTVATQAGDQKIDGADSIILESPYASVRLIYVVEDQWRVF